METPCKVCRGDGVQKKTETISVHIPAGVTSGNYLPLRGKGNAGPRGGSPGDLLVFIQEVDHPVFQRHDDDVILYLPVSYSQAALGAQVEVPTLSGKVLMTIPKGTQTNRLFRLRGKGIPHLHGSGRGDEIVRVIVWTPTKLAGDGEDLLKKLADHESKDFPTPEQLRRSLDGRG